MNQRQAIHELDIMKRDVAAAANRQIPARAAEVALHLFNRNFQEEGFFGEKWKTPQRRETTVTRNGKTVDTRYKYGVRNGRKVRVRRSGFLPDDFKRKTLEGRKHVLSRSLRKDIPGDGTARIYSDPGYADVHNEGRRAGRGKGFTMPKRQFMGAHRTVDEAVEKVIRDGIDEVMKKYQQ
jgi:phage gpG-like protein